MGKLILHIGGHRTGSTSVQKSLFENRARLREHGVLYPQTGLITVAHHQLGFSLQNRRHQPFQTESGQMVPEYMPLLDELEAEVAAAGCDTVLISSETFCELILYQPNAVTAPGLSRLFAIFDEVKILQYVRHQVPMIESQYKFRASWELAALTMDFPEYLRLRMPQAILRYLEMEQFFRAIRPDLDFEFVSFARASKAGPLVQQFYERAGMAPCFDGEEVRINESQSRSGTLAMVMWNQGRVPAETVTRDQFLDWCRQTFPVTQESLYDAGLLEDVAAQFAKPNAEFLARTGIDLTEELVDFQSKYQLCGSRLSAELEAQILAHPVPTNPAACTPAPAPTSAGWAARLMGYLTFKA